MYSMFPIRVCRQDNFFHLSCSISVLLPFICQTRSIGRSHGCSRGYTRDQERFEWERHLSKRRPSSTRKIYCPDSHSKSHYRSLCTLGKHITADAQISYEKGAG